MVVHELGVGAVTVTVRAMTPGDLPFAAALHQQCLPHGLFPMLGRRFLQRYLETYLRGSAGVALVAEWEGTTAGFLVGIVDESAHYRQVVRRHGLTLAASGLLALAARPTVALWFVRTRALRYVAGLRRLAVKPAIDTNERSDARLAAVLSHVAVQPQLRGARAGSMLVDAFTTRAAAADAPCIRLTTRSGTAGASDFYAKLGWREVGGFVDADGLSWARLQLDLR